MSILPPDALPLRLVPTVSARYAGGVDVVAQIMVEVEQRPRMARVEDGCEVRADREGVDEALAKLVVEDHALVCGLDVRSGVPRMIDGHEDCGQGVG